MKQEKLFFLNFAYQIWKMQIFRTGDPEILRNCAQNSLRETLHQVNISMANLIELVQ